MNPDYYKSNGKDLFTRFEEELVEENDEMYLEAKRLGYKLVEASSEDNS